MSYNKWTPQEMFCLYQYPNVTKEELAEYLDRSKVSIQNKIQELNISTDYKKNENQKRHTLRQFCSDCCFDKKECKCNPLDCIESSDAELYLNFYNIVYEKEEKIKLEIDNQNNTKHQRLIQ